MRHRVGVGVLLATELTAGSGDPLGDWGCGEKTPLLPPSLLEACSTSSYPQAKASEFQSQGGREEVLKEKEKGTSSPWVKWGTSRGWQGQARDAGWRESFWFIPLKPLPCTPHSFMSRSSKSQCCVSCVSLGGYESLCPPPRVSGDCLGPQLCVLRV